VKSEKSTEEQTMRSNWGFTGNANIASLIAALTGSATGQEERTRCIWVTG